VSVFVISCGGTGGHLSPGIALAERLIERGHSCILIISRKNVDSRLVEKYPYLELTYSPAVACCKKPFGFVRFFCKQIESVIFSCRLLKKQKPKAVISFGGFTTFGIALASLVMGCPLAIHESNRKPGRAVRLFSGLAGRVYLPDGVKLKGASLKRVKYLEYPLRKEIRPIAPKEARRKLGFSPDGKWLVVIGGSQGAKALNDWVTEHFQSLGDDAINVYCITGEGKGHPGIFKHKSATGQTSQLCYVPFSEKMAWVLSSADLVVARAGAGTIAEIIWCQTPSILVPYPYAKDNHQLANARYLEQQGGSILIEENQIHNLYKEVRDLIFNDWLLAKFRDNLKRLTHKESSILIAKDLEEYSKAFHAQRRI
jgi:UDP-N-acetylglucosamine--N-acetylmuramyl-(pentapeptide) pyrophosphoryl-undecaprenol N-acetylglucosamine transferase